MDVTKIKESFSDEWSQQKKARISAVFVQLYFFIYLATNQLLGERIAVDVDMKYSVVVFIFGSFVILQALALPKYNI